MKNELCKILGVSTSASTDEIHAAFRKKAREHHPDLGGERKQFQKINTAYEKLLKLKEAEKLGSIHHRSGAAQTSKPASSPTSTTASQNPTSGPNSNARPKRQKSPRAPKSPSEASRSAMHLLTGKLPLQDQTTYFILVNTLDIFLTYLHLRTGNVEANPIARFFINQWDIVGMVAFKLTIVATVCVIAQVVALKSLQRAGRLLNFGTAFIACVVLYSVWLLAR